jgi:hypothetical protein
MWPPDNSCSISILDFEVGAAVPPWWRQLSYLNYRTDITVNSTVLMFRILFHQRYGNTLHVITKFNIILYVPSVWMIPTLPIWQIGLLTYLPTWNQASHMYLNVSRQATPSSVLQTVINTKVSFSACFLGFMLYMYTISRKLAFAVLCTFP